MTERPSGVRGFVVVMDYATCQHTPSRPQWRHGTGGQDSEAPEIAGSDHLTGIVGPFALLRRPAQMARLKPRLMGVSP